MFQSVRIASRGTPEALVVGCFSKGTLDAMTKALDADGSIAAAAKRKEFSGALGSCVECFPQRGARVVLVGLGDAKSLEPGHLRLAAAAAGRKLSAALVTRVKFELDGPLKQAKLDATASACALGEGLGLLSWTYDDLRGSATDTPKRAALGVIPSGKAQRDGLERGLLLAEGANLTRTLSQTPPNIATTTYMAAQARKLARATGLTCTVMKGATLEKERLVGHATVGAASEHEPCMVRLEYRPARGAKNAKPLVIVGKTITYDTGGLSLKINNSMKGMKRDKDGGCAVLGAMHIIAQLKPKRPVVALLCVAENSISDEAYRPDDVLEFRNGVTVEVTNTDAEGRLVLADGLAWACEKEDPHAVVDICTLTGGVVVALGRQHAGLWCDDEKLRAKVEAASDATGERVWRMPLVQDHRDLMKSPVADIHNSAPVREVHATQGAAFLSYFVDKSVPWAHLDIAGTHVIDKDAGPIVAGPTGSGARLLATLAESL